MKLYIDFVNNWKREKTDSHTDELMFIPFYLRFRNTRTIYKDQICDRHFMIEIEILNFFFRFDLKLFPVVK